MSQTAYASMPIRPIQHGLSSTDPPLYLAQGYSPWVANCRVYQNSLRKRPGTKLYRNVGRPVYGIYLYQTVDGTRSTLVLTDTDLIKIESGGTWSYLTDTYVTGTVDSISNAGADAVVTGTGTPAWNTGGIAAGDKFIVDSDHNATNEPDAKWATIKSVDGATQITLSGHYANASATGTYKIRKVYSMPLNSRWNVAIMGDRFMFGNANIPVQSWGGTGYAADLNATYALHAVYMIEYANRLLLGNVDVGGTQSAITLRWSKENDPTDWTDSTAGELDLQDTSDFISGLGKVGDNLVIYEQRNILVYGRTGEATNPIQRVAERRGVGNAAPYSIVSVEGSNYFIGSNDFYTMDSDNPLPMEAAIRHIFFDLVGGTELKNVFGSVDQTKGEAYWFATTSLGKVVFVYDYKVKEWGVYYYNAPHNFTTHGMGLIQ